MTEKQVFNGLFSVIINSTNHIVRVDMYDKIVIPLALEQGHCPRLLEIARRLKSENGEIIAVHVIDQIPGFAKTYLSSESEHKIEQSVRDKIEKKVGAEKDVEPVILKGQPGRTLTEYAHTIGADCIVVGAHKPELKDFFLGSTAARIVRYAKCSVHVLR